MTKLNIEGRTVNVDDSFMQLSPEEQESTVHDIAKQLGVGPAAAPAAPPTTLARIGSQTLRGVPVAGPAITNRFRTPEDEAWEQAHPWLSTGLQTLGGGAALALAPEAEGMALGTSMIPRALGMVGRLRTAAPLAGLTGAGLGAADAAARGEDPEKGAIGGALTGVGGVVGGKAAGALYDAALRRFRPLPPVQRYMPGGPVAGVDIPVTGAQEATAQGRPDIAASRADERDRKMGVQTAVDATQATNDAMAQAHDNFANMINPQTSPGPSMHPLDAGEAAISDLVGKEQARAQADVARMQGAQAGTQTLRQGYAPGAAAPPASALDAAETFGQGIRTRQAAARQATNNAYARAAQVDAAYNPLLMRNASDQILGIVNSEPGLVRISQRTTPGTFDALQGINDEIQAQMTLAAQRGAQFGPADMEQIRQALNIQRGNVIAAARQSGKYADVQAFTRLMDGFDEWEQQLVHTPGSVGPDGRQIAGGLLHGDPAEIFATRQAARAAHAQERQTFGRRGPGDPVGSFMGNVLGRYPGTELSPEGIVKALIGSPDRPFNENSVPILNHLRDNVFGANSPEWAQLKQGLVDHLTATPPGGREVTTQQQVARIERYLANNRLAAAINTPQERADLAAHAATLRAAIPAAPPASGTIEREIAEMGGRFGQRGSGAQVLNRIFGADGDQVAQELQRRLDPDVYNQLRLAAWRRISEAPEGVAAWQDQKIGNTIANNLNKPGIRQMFTPQERQIMQQISQAHLNLVPTPGSTNVSGTAYMQPEVMGRYLDGMKGFLLKMIAAHVGHLPGYLFAEGAERIAAKRAQRAAAESTVERFIGPRGVRPAVTAPQRFGATAGRLIRPPSGSMDQAEQQSGE